MPANVILRKTSLVDYPGRVVSVFFFSGCNFRCPWCHNSTLVSGGEENAVRVEDALAHVQKRRAVLGGVVLSGGEPCLRKELPDIIREIKKIPSAAGSAHLKIKLDTNGAFPEVLETLFRREETRPDYIALDLKIAPERYAELLPGGAERPPSGTAERPENAIRKSAALIRDSGIAHEYRTLALPSGAITRADIDALAPLADDSPWYFRPFRAGNCLDPAWNSLEESAARAAGRLETLAARARKLGKNAVLFAVDK